MPELMNPFKPSQETKVYIRDIHRASGHDLGRDTRIQTSGTKVQVPRVVGI